jgi:hypothetical protein
MPTFKPVILFAATLFCMDAVAAPPAYDGKTPMLEVGNMWLDPAMSAEDQHSVAQSLAQANANIVAAYGTRLGSSLVVWCKTMECVSFFSGSDGRSYANPGNGKRRYDAQYAFSVPALVITRQARYPKSVRAVEVLTHEISHIEFQARLRGEPVPAWFNEGIATYLGEVQHCRPGMRGIDDLSKLASPARWHEYTNQSDRNLVLSYCQARNEVGAWIAEHGGFAAVLELLVKRSKGRSFASLYGRQPELLPDPAAPSPKPAASSASADDSSNQEVRPPLP